MDLVWRYDARQNFFYMDRFRLLLAALDGETDDSRPAANGLFRQHLLLRQELLTD